MFNLDAITSKNDDKKWPYGMLIIGPSASDEPLYQFLVKKRENAGIKKLNDPSAFIEYSNTMMFTTILMITIQKEKEKF